VILFVKLGNLTLNKLEWYLAYSNRGLATLLISHIVKIIKNKNIIKTQCKCHMLRLLNKKLRSKSSDKIGLYCRVVEYKFLC
jgi:hypothetical protein